jgi:two-component system, cell cycle response regulator
MQREAGRRVSGTLRSGASKGPYERGEHILVPQLITGVWKENHSDESILGTAARTGTQQAGPGNAAVRMLVAGNDCVTLGRLESQLSKWGYNLTVCRDGGEAWRILQSKDAPKLAILDRFMPKMGGPEICRRLRALDGHPYVYVILVTSKKEKEGIREGLDAGADDYIVKPFDPNELKVRVRAAVLQDQLRSALTLAEFRASRDALTGLLNRASILEILSKELIRSSRLGSPLGVIIGDLDHFKKINDLHGHLAGDAVLKDLAKMLSAAVRPYDAVGRYGGEEFIIVLPDCDTEMSRQAAERIRRVVEETPMVAGEADLRITMSFGVAAFHGGTTISADHAVKLADEALYRAKNGGRNRVDLCRIGGIQSQSSVTDLARTVCRLTINEDERCPRGAQSSRERLSTKSEPVPSMTN